MQEIANVVKNCSKIGGIHFNNIGTQVQTETEKTTLRLKLESAWYALFCSIRLWKMLRVVLKWQSIVIAIMIMQIHKIRWTITAKYEIPLKTKIDHHLTSRFHIPKLVRRDNISSLSGRQLSLRNFDRNINPFNRAENFSTKLICFISNLTLVQCNHLKTKIVEFPFLVFAWRRHWPQIEHSTCNRVLDQMEHLPCAFVEVGITHKNV